MIRLFFALCAALVSFSAACGSEEPEPDIASTEAVASEGPTGVGAGCSPGRPFDNPATQRTIAVNGMERGYRLHVPATYDGSAATPLVIVLHSFGTNAQFIAGYAGLDTLADEAGFVTVTPEGSGTPTRWNVRKDATEADDVAFIRDLLEEIDGELCIDPDRMYAAGYSNGGGMAQLLACEIPDRIAAIGVVAGTYVSCQAKVPMVAFHGTADPVVPIDGGEIPAEQGGGALNPVRRSVSEWGRALGCDGLQMISRPSANVELSTFPNCERGDGKALLYAIVGGGHTWPGATPLPVEVVGATSDEIDATATMWEFFDANPLAH